MYANFRRFSVSFDPKKGTFSIYYDGMGEIVREGRIAQLLSVREPQVTLEDYAPPVLSVKREDSFSELTVSWSGAAMKCAFIPSVSFRKRLNAPAPPMSAATGSSPR